VSAYLRVAETFGPTLQGEGPAAGQAASFVRLMGCNLSCSWCDTPFTWDASRFDLRAETTIMSGEQVARAVQDGPKLVVLTGGEPLLQQGGALIELLSILQAWGKTVHVETNGTVLPTRETRDLVDLFVVSPKLRHAGGHRGHQDPAMHPGWRRLAAFREAALKVVVKEPADVETAARLGHQHRFPRDMVWVMPEGVTAEELAGRWLPIAEAAAAHHINASHRLHVLAWGEKRGH
jgi:7-cyano-7-deazaguanosine (preQ0) biosynthesis protein QueE